MAEGVLGRDLWAEPLWAGERITRFPAVFRTVEYQLELRTVGNALVSILRNHDNGEWTEEVNRPDTLTFTYPAEDDDVQYFVKPYQIWLRDSVSGVLLQRFKIMQGKASGVFPNVFQVFCQDFMIQLNQEWIESYVKTVTDAFTFRQILQGYLDHQANTNKVTIGNLGTALAARQTNTNVSNKTVLNAIETIHETVEGFYHVNWARRIDWAPVLTPDSGQEFRRGKNMKGITETVRYDELVNRLYAYGHGSKRSTRLNLIDAGEANEYIDHGGSIAAYGIHCGYTKDASIENAAELLAKANVVLALRKDPRLDYTISIVDLSMSALKELAYEQIYLGSPRRIIDEKLGISTSQNVVKIVRSLKNPLDVKVNLANIPRNLSALWKKLTRDVTALDEDALSPFTDEDAFEETLETVLGITDAPTEIGTWNTATDTGTLNDLMEDIYEAMIADDVAVSDLKDDWESLLEDITGATDASTDICYWNDAADTGNLDTHLADMMNHDDTPVLTAIAPLLDATPPVVGVEKRGAHGDHQHPIPVMD